MKRIKFFVLISLLSLSIFWFGAFIIFNTLIRSAQIDDKKTDAIVVLTGGKNRINEAFNLFNKDMADLLIISGVADKVTMKELQKQNNADITKNYNKIILGKEAKNTHQNAIEVSEYIRRNNVRSVRLVTSYYHMPRSKEEILAHNPDIEIVIHPVFSQNVSFKWWKNLNSFILVASEFNKFVFVYSTNFVSQIFERN